MVRHTFAFLLALMVATACSPDLGREPVQPVDIGAYPWLSGTVPDTVTALEHAFPAPSGFVRSTLEPGSWGQWLRGLPLLTERQQPRTFANRPSFRTAAGIIALDVGHRDLQQCADTWIRLHAEYLWSIGSDEHAGYHLTSGDLIRWRDWTAGEQLLIHGSKVQRRSGPPRASDHRSYRTWLDLVFAYAGTRSLHLDAAAPAVGPVAPGDAFVSAGSPGHAIIVLDTAFARDGRQAAVLGEGYMPAQELSVIRGRQPNALEGVWFLLPRTPSDTLDVPTWPEPFALADLLRLPTP